MAKTNLYTFYMSFYMSTYMWGHMYVAVVAIKANLLPPALFNCSTTVGEPMKKANHWGTSQ